ncbi:MAG: LuxR family transcriptional regulator [Coriobacteriales bacterium]|jgi:DNA-binding CsgD family transcriptional regulator
MAEPAPSTSANETRAPWPELVLAFLGVSLLWPTASDGPLSIAWLLDSGRHQAGVLCVVSLVAYAVSVIVSVLARESFRSTLRRAPRRRPALAVAAGVCCCAGVSVVRAHGVPSAVYVAALALEGFCVYQLLSAWTDRLPHLGSAARTVVVLASFCASEIVKLLVSLFGANILWPALPLLSSCALASMAWHPAIPGRAVPSGDGGGGEAMRPVDAPRLRASSILPYVGFVILWSFALGMSSDGAFGSMSDEDRYWLYGASFVALAACTAYFVLVLRARPARMRRDALFLVPLASVVVIYMGVLVMMMFRQSMDFGFFKRALLATESCLEALLLAQIVASVPTGRSLDRALGVYAVLLNSGTWLVIGEMLRVAGSASFTLMSGGSATLVLFATAMVLTVALLAVAVTPTRGSDPDKGEDEGTRTRGRAADSERGGAPVQGAPDKIRLACTRAARDAALTPRELEVMEMLCRGYSARRVSSELGISDRTVHFHTENLYRKLGIHSKQGLIVLVESQGGNRPTA